MRVQLICVKKMVFYQNKKFSVYRSYIYLDLYLYGLEQFCCNKTIIIFMSKYPKKLDLEKFNTY